MLPETCTMRLRERVALITGGGGGVGSIIATALAAAGASLMLLGRSEDRLQTRASILRAAGHEVAWLRADVGEPEAMQAAVAATIAKYGGLDILVNCAGRYGPFGPIHRVDPQAWAANIRTNLIGTFNAIWAAVPAMIDGGRGGTIINLSGGGSSKGRPTFSAYASSKTGVVRLTETVAEELRPYDIGVYVIAPGGVYTEMTEELLRSAAAVAPGDIAEAERIKATGGNKPGTDRRPRRLPRLRCRALSHRTLHQRCLGRLGGDSAPGERSRGIGRILHPPTPRATAPGRESMNVGIVGAGRQGWRRARALELFPDDRLVAVADRDTAAAQRLAAAYGAASCTDWVALVTRPDVGAVLVCTPPDSHAEIAVTALERGRHVLVEKPLARSVAEAEPIVTAAQAAFTHGVVCAVGFNYRHHPAIRRARRWVDEGAIGELMWARMRHGIAGRKDYAADWRASADTSGGGELLDQGIHLLDLARWFFGDFSEVRAMLTTAYWPITPLEDNAFVLLRTAAGQVVQLHASWTEWRNLFSLELFGRNGYVRVEGLGGSYGTETAVHGRRDFDAPFSEQVIEYRGEDSSWRSEWAAFRDAAVKRRPPETVVQDGLAALALVARVYEAAHGSRRQ